MPEISVIIPVYNVEKYINCCVDSVLIQSFKDYELILVDDGSPDKCPEICDEWANKDDRIRVIHQKNQGLSAARNVGITAARGEYLLFLDSDDVIHPDCLQILMNCIKKTRAEVALGRFRRFNESVSEKDFEPWDGTYVCKSNLQTLDCLFESAERLPSLISACGKLWKKELFQKTGFPVGRLFEDEYTTYKLYFRANQIAFVDTNLYFYFVNDGGITRNLTLEKRFDEYDAQWERLQFFQQQNLTELQGKAALSFLKTAQWDVIACRENREPCSAEKKQRLMFQYKEALVIAKKLGALEFLKHYDYYVLAYPQRTLYLRIKRLLMLVLKKKA